MAYENFKPIVWSTAVMQELQKSLVYGNPAIINRNYEGDIRRAGDTVRIPTLGAVSVFSYTPNSDMSAPQVVSDAASLLVADQIKAVNFTVDDVDRVQSNVDMLSMLTSDAAYRIADEMDRYIAALYSQIATANFIGSEGSPKTDLGTVGNPYNYLLDLDTLLTENNVPMQGRFVVIPAWFKALLLKDNSRFILSTPQGENRLATGEIGMVGGLRVFVSNNVPYTTSTTKFKIIAGHSLAWTMAMKKDFSLEAYRPEKRFSDAVKGFTIYGAKVTRPSALACLVANKA